MERTTCCVVGGGPAGMVLALLLARAGVEVTVLEKHGDFLRDFRGDTVHPSTMTLLDELGLGAKFDQLPYRRIDVFQVPVTAGAARIGDFRRLPGKRNYIALVPQWDFLDLIADAGRAEPGFRLRMNTEVTGVRRENGRVVGVRYRTSDGVEGELRADLTVGCDGRTSVVRADAGLSIRDFGAPIDVWWFRLPRYEGDFEGGGGRFSGGRLLVLIDRGDYFQMAYLIPKGADSRLRSQSIESLHSAITELLPWLADRVDNLRSWDEVKLLNVRLDRLRRWYTDGLLCIGDAAHAMSPVGGVGVNLAIQDAVAAARYLAGPLRAGRVTESDLARVQRRRWLPTALTQKAQQVAHDRVLKQALRGKLSIDSSARLPAPLRLLNRVPILQAVPAYAIGIGVRPEHAPEFARRS